MASSPAISRAAGRPRCSAAGRSSWRACWSTPPTSDRAWAPASGRRASSTAGCSSSSSSPAGIGILARVVLVREERLAWSLIGAGALAWAAGDIYWWLAFSGSARGAVPLDRRRPLPRLLPARLRRRRAAGARPGAPASTPASGSTGSRPPSSSAAIGVAVLHAADPRGERGRATAAAVATNLAYPLGDLVVPRPGGRARRPHGLAARPRRRPARRRLPHLHARRQRLPVQGRGRAATPRAASSTSSGRSGMVCMGLAAWQPSPRARAAAASRAGA